MNPLDYRYHIHPDLWLKLVAKSQKFDNFGFSSSIDGILVNIFVPAGFSDIYIKLTKFGVNPQNKISIVHNPGL